MSRNAIRTKATIVIPIHNGASTLNDVFDSLERQNDQGLIDRLMLIDDNSSDESVEIIARYRERSSFDTALISNRMSKGLAAGYNEGMRRAETEYVILMHQDILLTSPDSINAIMSPLIRNEAILASYPVILHPIEIWSRYGFWQKCLFSRFVNKEVRNQVGKFDCYRRQLLIDDIGFFDEINFRTAGEDGDMLTRIKKKGIPTANAEVRAIHLHSKAPDFNLGALFRKEAQLAEARGCLLKKSGIGFMLKRPRDFLLSFFRELLVIGLLIPCLQMISFVLIIVYSVLYTKLVYLHEYRNPRVLALPLLNACLLFVNALFCLRGYRSGKQRL